MKGLNKVMLIGRLGRDPELRYTQGGQPFCRFSIATDDSWTDKDGERQTRTEWHNVVAWRKLAEICNQYLKKGRLVYVEGRIESRNWEDDSGNKRYATDIVINNMQMLESNRDGDERQSGSREQPRQPEPEYDPSGPITDDDVPF